MPLSFPTLCFYLIYKGDESMNYQKHYDLLIDRGLKRKSIEVSESHHIIPRCMGGSDGKKNRVNLTPEEHYLAHQLLTRIYPESYGLKVAAVMMATDNRNGKRSNNKLYGWLRKQASVANSERLKGVPLSIEHIENMKIGMANSEARQEHYESMRGVPRTEDAKLKMSESHKTSEKAIAARDELNKAKIGVPRSPETCKKLSEVQIGKVLTEEHKENISNSLKGKPKTLEHNAKVSAALKGNQNCKGNVLTDEHKEKIRQSKIGTKMSPEAIKKMVDNKTPEQRRAGALKAWETKRRNKELALQLLIAA